MNSEIRAVLDEMRGRKVNRGKHTSPTLEAWADRIEKALTVSDDVVNRWRFTFPENSREVIVITTPAGKEWIAEEGSRLYTLAAAALSTPQARPDYAELLARERAATEWFALRVLGEDRYGNSPCQAHPLQLVEEYIEELKAAPSTPSALIQRSGEHLVIRFGEGSVAVSTGTRDGEACVFLREPPEPGAVGEPLAHDKADMPLRVAMLFPTKERAQAVADALVGTPSAQVVGHVCRDVSQARMVVNLPEGTPLYTTPSAQVSGGGEVLYTADEVDEAMEVLRGKNGSTALVGEVLDQMEATLRAALSAPQARPDPLCVKALPECQFPKCECKDEQARPDGGEAVAWEIWRNGKVRTSLTRPPMDGEVAYDEGETVRPLFDHPTPTPDAVAELREQIAEGKAQWDRVAKAIGADGDDVDDVFAKADAVARLVEEVGRRVEAWRECKSPLAAQEAMFAIANAHTFFTVEQEATNGHD